MGSEFSSRSLQPSTFLLLFCRYKGLIWKDQPTGAWFLSPAGSGWDLDVSIPWPPRSRGVGISWGTPRAPGTWRLSSPPLGSRADRTLQSARDKCLEWKRIWHREGREEVMGWDHFDGGVRSGTYSLPECVTVGFEHRQFLLRLFAVLFIWRSHAGQFLRRTLYYWYRCHFRRKRSCRLREGSSEWAANRQNLSPEDNI